MKKLLLRFITRFYDSKVNYIEDVDKLIKKWTKSLVQFIIAIILEGIMFWLVLLSLISIFPIDWIHLGPGAWNLLNIIQLGLISWFFEKTYSVIRRKTK